jgi:hypothetical protein
MCEPTELEFHEQGTASGNILSSSYPFATAGLQRQPKRKTSNKNEEKAREKQGKHRNYRKKV